MGQHLVARGYRQIGFVGDWLDRALLQAGLPRRPPYGHGEKSSPGLGGDKLMAVLAEDPALDALFFANDDLAVDALLRAQREGIAVPGRIAIAGFNGLEIGALTSPALTSVVSPRQQIGSTAARKLLDRIQGKDAGPPGVDVAIGLRYVPAPDATPRENVVTERVGFIGLGHMGHGIASNLVGKGFPFTALAPQARRDRGPAAARLRQAHRGRSRRRPRPWCCARSGASRCSRSSTARTASPTRTRSCW